MEGKKTEGRVGVKVGVGERLKTTTIKPLRTADKQYTLLQKCLRTQRSSHYIDATLRLRMHL